MRGTRTVLTLPRAMTIAVLLYMLLPVPMHPATFCAALFTGMLTGALIGRAQRRDLCSDPGCQTALPPFLHECPSCLGEIHGEIDHIDQRLEADEACARREASSSLVA